MKEELNEKMHSEFKVDSETDIKHKAMCIWCYNLYESKEEIIDACDKLGITYEQALEFKPKS